MHRTVFTLFIVVGLLSSIFFGNGTILYAKTSSVRADLVLVFTNIERYRAGRELLVSNPILTSVAQEKMRDLFAREYFEHVSPSGESVSDLAKKAGYEYVVVGENLAMGDFVSSKEVVDAWMNSPGHKKNILSTSFTEIGIASGRGMYHGRETWMIVQSFGYPRANCAQIDAVLEKKVQKIEKKLQVFAAIAEVRKKEIEKGGTLNDRQQHVVAYNEAARMYNESVQDYKSTVKKLNKQVERYNACVRKIVGKLDE